MSLADEMLAALRVRGLHSTTTVSRIGRNGKADADVGSSASNINS